MPSKAERVRRAVESDPPVLVWTRDWSPRSRKAYWTRLEPWIRDIDDPGPARSSSASIGSEAWSA